MTTHETDLGNVRAALFAAVASLGLMGGAPLAQVPTAAQPKQAEIRGTVRAADTGLALRNAEVRLSGGPLKSPRSAFTDDAGRYRLADVAPGRYLIAASKLGYAKAGYGENAPVQDYVVVAFSEDRERWREPTRYVVRTRPDQHAQFKLAGLPPGTYHVAALRDLEDGKEFDAQFLESLRAVSTRLTLERHASIAVSLPLVRAPQ